MLPDQGVPELWNLPLGFGGLKEGGFKKRVVLIFFHPRVLAVSSKHWSLQHDKRITQARGFFRGSSVKKEQPTPKNPPLSAL